MRLLFSLFAFLSSNFLSSPPFRIVLVDAFTRKPLSGVSVKTNDETQQSDSNGIVVLSSKPHKVQFSYAGYSSVTVSLGSGSVLAADTFGLFPKPILLADAIINSRQYFLSTTSKDHTSPYQYATNLLIPGQRIAVVYQRPACQKSYYLREIQVQFLRKFAEGRLMINIESINDEGKPSGHNLLSDSIITFKQLRHIKNGWIAKIDISRHDLLMPERGLAIVVECLTSSTNEKIVGTHKVPEKDNSFRMMVDTKVFSPNNEIQRVTSFVDYPQLSTSMELVAQSWVWRPPVSQWTLNKWGVINSNGQHLGNPIVSLVVNQL